MTTPGATTPHDRTSDDPGDDATSDRGRRRAPARRTPKVVLTEDGPVLVPGPVDVVLPDGTRVRSTRPVTAVCLCRRSRRYPFCDTSHRDRVRTGTGRAQDERPC